MKLVTQGQIASSEDVGDYNCLQKSHFSDIYFLRRVSLAYVMMCCERRDVPREMWALQGEGCFHPLILAQSKIFPAP